MNGDPLFTARNLTRALSMLIDEAIQDPERHAELPTLAGLLINQIATAIATECGPVDFFAARMGVDPVAYAKHIFADADAISTELQRSLAQLPDDSARAELVRKLVHRGALSAAAAGAGVTAFDS